MLFYVQVWIVYVKVMFLNRHLSKEFCISTRVNYDLLLYYFPRSPVTLLFISLALTLISLPFPLPLSLPIPFPFYSCHSPFLPQ